MCTTPRIISPASLSPISVLSCVEGSMLGKHFKNHCDFESQQPDFCIGYDEIDHNQGMQEEDALLQSISAVELSFVRNGLKWLKQNQDCEKFLRCTRRRSFLNAGDELAALEEVRILRASSCVENAQANTSFSRTSSSSSSKAATKRGPKINGSAILFLVVIVYAIFLYLLLCKTGAAPAAL
jgi:hypothetical protein